MILRMEHTRPVMMSEQSPDDSRSEDLTKYIETEEEWDNVMQITPTFQENAGNVEVGVKTANVFVSPVTTLDQVYVYLNSGVLETYTEQLIEPEKSSMDYLFNCMCTLRPLPPQIEQSKQTIMLTALMPFCNEERVHVSVLRTLYRRLTGSRVDCPRYGHHWEDIGFQGNDPSTDLRGVGFLGLIQMLYLVMTPEIFPLAKDIYALSLKESQEFPLMVLSLNVTRICLHILRDGILDKFCYKDEDCWGKFNSLYAGLMYHIYHIWKTQHKTISNSGFVLKDAETVARKEPGRLMDELYSFLALNYTEQEVQSARNQINKDAGLAV